jgi:tetratricopeptide (TPR) repeat protein
VILLLVLTVMTPQARPSADSDYEEQLQAAISLHDAGDYAGAIATYRALLDLRPKDPLVLYEIAYSSMKAGRYKDAIKYVKRSLSSSSEYAQPCYLVLAGSYDLLGSWKKGEKVLRRALSEYPENSLLHYNLGVNLQGQGELPEATSAFQDALYLNPVHPNSWRALAQTLEWRGHRARAVAMYTRFLTVAPESTLAPAIAASLWGQISAGVTHDPEAGEHGATTITSDPSTNADEAEPEFAESLAMSVVAASRYLDEHTTKTDVQYISVALEKVLKILWEIDENRPDQKSFWNQYVLSYFRAASEAGHFHAMTYDIRRSLADDEIHAWIQEHKEAIDRYRQWHEEWQP